MSVIMSKLYSQPPVFENFKTVSNRISLLVKSSRFMKPHSTEFGLQRDGKNYKVQIEASVDMKAY